MDRQDIDRVVEAVEPGARVVRTERLTGGVSAEVRRVDLRTTGGAERSVVVRGPRADRGPVPTDPVKGAPDAVREFAVLDALHRAGVPVPRPLAVVPVSDALLVLEWVEGTTEVAGGDLDGALEQLADVVARLHALDPAIVPAGVLGPIEDPFDAVVPLLPDTDLGRRLREVLGPERGRRTATARTSILHGDVWPGNALWHDGRLAAVLDWEDSCVGDPLADLACARVELRCAYGVDAMERFTDRYLEQARRTRTSVELDGLPLWEVYVSAAALAAMHRWGLDPATEARRRQETTQFFDDAAHRLLG